MSDKLTNMESQPKRSLRDLLKSRVASKVGLERGGLFLGKGFPPGPNLSVAPPIAFSSLAVKMLLAMKAAMNRNTTTTGVAKWSPANVCSEAARER